MSHKGTSTFIAQRVTSVLLVPFVIWFVWSVIAHAGDTPEAVRAWLSGPVTASAFAVFIAVTAYHMRIGLDEIITDYIYSGARGVLKGANALFCALIALAGFVAAFLLAFQG